MINILVIESVLIHSDTLKNMILEYGTKLNIYTATNYESAKKIYENQYINIFIIDISIQDSITGIKLAEELRKNTKYEDVPIIFTANSYKPEVIYQAINSIHCFSYIIKPFYISDIHKALDDIFKKYNLNNNGIFNIRDTNGIYIPIKKDSIIYIESSNHLLTYYTKEGKVQSGRKRLTDILCMLDSRFIQSHKKYIINTSYIKNYDKTNRMITIFDSHLPVGRSYKSNLDKKIS